MSDEMREARDKWLRDKGYYSKNEMEPSVERAAKALRDAAREGFQAGAAWQAAQPVQVDDAEESVLKIFHDLFPWFTNEGGGPSSHDFVRAIRPYLSKQPVSVGEEEIKSLIQEQLPSFGVAIYDPDDIGNAKYAGFITDSIYEAIRPYLRQPVQVDEDAMTDKPILPLKCILCGDEAAVVVKADNGCTCAANVYQPRCMQHLLRLRDSDAGCFEVVEDFRVGEWRDL